MVKFAYERKYKEVCLLSGDADYMKALEVVKKQKKKIKILCLPNRIPVRLSYHFPTFVLSIPGFQSAFTFDKNQKITILEVDVSKIVKTVKNRRGGLK